MVGLQAGRSAGLPRAHSAPLVVRKRIRRLTVVFVAVQWCIKTAKERGCAVATTRNHHHFGAAVQWSRMAMKEDCIAIAVSSHRYELPPESSVTRVNGTSPISIAIPGVAGFAAKRPDLAMMGLLLFSWVAATLHK